MSFWLKGGQCSALVTIVLNKVMLSQWYTRTLKAISACGLGDLVLKFLRETAREASSTTAQVCCHVHMMTREERSATK